MITAIHFGQERLETESDISKQLIRKGKWVTSWCQTFEKGTSFGLLRINRNVRIVLKEVASTCG